MLERNKAETMREVNIRGNGPESTRAGRPWPMSKADRLAQARSAVERKKAQELAFQRKEKAASHDPLRIRRGFTLTHIRVESSSKQSNAKLERGGDAPQWNQLKRRQISAVQEAPNQSKVRFIEGRQEREMLAKSRSYTPLESRSILETRKEDPRSQVRPSTLPETEESRPSSAASHLETYMPLLDASISQARDQVQDPKQKTPRIEINREQERGELEEREERQGRQPSRSAAPKPLYEAAPRGRDRDKARRRQQFVEEDEEGDDVTRRETLRRAEEKKRRKAEKAAKKTAAPTPILLPEYISISNLAVALKVRFEDFVEILEELGYEETNHDYILNAEDAGLIAMEFNYEAIIDRSESEDLKAREPAEDPSSLPPRPPVVTIMGHVDHGKTTLLDWLRKSSVAATEHGGITQHIGAFSVPMPSGKTITFLDTPGHAAFLSMRQRGANVTDIVILVVAADDSVKPQTIEAINHAKAARVPIIVAINKIDKPEINIDRVKQDLARRGVEIEDYGGDTQVVCVSGKTGQGMAELEEAALTLSEILDMRAERDGPAEGWVLEASIKSMGKVATVLVRRGTMRPGDFIVAGNTWARIRCLRNEAGLEIQEAGPGLPVEIDGWREQPVAGDEVLQAFDEAKAKSVVDYRLEKIERDKMAEDMEAVNLMRKAEQEKRVKEKRAVHSADKHDEGVAPIPHKETSSGAKVIHFIVKGDVSGSVEAVLESISQVGNKEVEPRVLRAGVGQLSEFDVEHAAAAKGHLVNFNTPVDPHIARLADQSKVRILDHNIIYRLVDDVKAELSKHLPPLVTQRVTGEAEIAQIFSINIKKRQQQNIAGCKVRNGTISKSAKVRVLRKNEKVFDGMPPPSLVLSLACSCQSMANHLHRHAIQSQERQEGRPGDEEGQRVRHGIRGLDGLRDWRSRAELRGEGRDEVSVILLYFFPCTYLPSDILLYFLESIGS